MKPTINQQKNFWASMNPVLLQFTNAAYSETFWTPERCALQRVRRTCKSLMAPLAYWEREPVEGGLRGALPIDGATQAEAQAVVDHVREAVRAVEGVRPPWQPYRDLWASRPACEHRGLEAFVHAHRLDGLSEGRIMQAVRVEVAWRDAEGGLQKRWGKHWTPDHSAELAGLREDGTPVEEAAAFLNRVLLMRHPEALPNGMLAATMALLAPDRWPLRGLHGVASKDERKAARELVGPARRRQRQPTVTALSLAQGMEPFA